jgi:hypothetical protein
MAAIYDTQGTSAQLGVNRDIDRFGQSPPTFTIEGTTGWKRHQLDGYLYSGLSSMKALEKVLSTYQQLNQSVLESNLTDLYSLEFYDYFKGEYWQVEPVGRQGVWQSRERTLFVNYRFQWAAIKRVNAPIVGIIDALANVFGSPATATAANVVLGINNFINTYTPDGITGSTFVAL